MDAAEIEATARLIFENGTLKLKPRAGWLDCGIKHPESIAEHSFRTAFIAMILANLEGADPFRAAGLSVLHDSQESRVSDITHLGRRYLTAASNESVTEDQVRGLPVPVAQQFIDAVAEYEHDETVEVQVAHDADKLECLFQAVEYRDAGYQNVEAYIENMLKALKTKSGRQLAEAAVSMSSQAWLKEALNRPVNP